MVHLSSLDMCFFFFVVYIVCSRSLSFIQSNNYQTLFLFVCVYCGGRAICPVFERNLSPILFGAATSQSSQGILSIATVGRPLGSLFHLHFSLMWPVSSSSFPKSPLHCITTILFWLFFFF